MNLKGRSFLTLKDFTKDEIGYLLDLVADLKAKKKKGITGNSLKGKNVALIFEKPSTRTRCSFTIGCIDEGGHPEYLGKDDVLEEDEYNTVGADLIEAALEKTAKNLI